MTPLPAGWALAASSFNWTPEVIRAQQPAEDIVTGIVADGVASLIELELGQLWRSYPTPSDAEIDSLRARIDGAGGRVSVVGVSIDDFAVDGSRRDDDARLAFLTPQLRAAHRLGAFGVRLPLGQAGRALIGRLLPHLDAFELTLFEEFQGLQAPDNPTCAEAFETIADLADDRVRLLCDISLLMPAAPVTYLARLRSEGVSPALLDLVEREWRSGEVVPRVLAELRAGSVPAGVHTLFMNLLIRFGRSTVTDLDAVRPWIGGFHLKFWDLDDTHGVVSEPIRELGEWLRGSDFDGFFTSEWGGHEWLDGICATEITRGHLALAGQALAAGGAS